MSLKGKSRPGDRIDQRHRAGHRRGAGGGGRGHHAERLRRCRRRSRRCGPRSRPRIGVKVGYNGADISKPEQIAAMVAETREDAGLARYPGEQRRHPVHRQCRGFPERAVGPDHRDQPVGRVPRHEGGDPGHEGEGLGADHQHRLGARAGRQPAEGRLCRGQARRGRHDQGGGDRTGQRRRDGQRDLPGLGADAAGGEAVAGPRATGTARRSSRKRTPSWPKSSRWRSSPRRSRSAGWRCSCARTRRATITGAPLSIDGGWVAQ